VTVTLTITEPINTLFRVVNFLMCCYRSVVLICCLNIDISQGSVATHLRCDGIFNSSIITNVLLFLTVKKVASLSILDEVIRRTENVPIFGPPCI